MPEPVDGFLVGNMSVIQASTWVQSQMIMLTQLLEVMGDYLCRVDCWKTAGNHLILYQYFRKAFDVVPRQHLLKKLEAYGGAAGL